MFEKLTSCRRWSDGIDGIVVGCECSVGIVEEALLDGIVCFSQN